MVLNIIFKALEKGLNDLRFWPECWSRVPVSPSSFEPWFVLPVPKYFTLPHFRMMDLSLSKPQCGCQHVYGILARGMVLKQADLLQISLSCWRIPIWISDDLLFWEVTRELHYCYAVQLGRIQFSSI
jgi:hypothetical protein